MALNFLNDGYFAGKVGIGTESPSYKFTAYGSSVDSEIVASFGSANDQNEYTAIGLSGFIASNGATKAGLALKRTSTYGTGELHFLNNNTTDNSDMTLSDSKMMINSSGNVGIGTTDPGQNLEISGQGNVAIRLTSTDSTTSTLQFADSNDVNVGMIQYDHGSNYMLFRTNDNERVRITSTGNVGIGDTTPLSKLEVAGSIKSTNYDTSHTSESGVTLGYNVTEAMAYLETWTSKPLTFRTYNYQAFNISGNEAMRIDTSRNVGIGTTSPIGKLNIQQSTLDIPFLFSGRYNSENEPILQMGESTEFSGSSSYGELLIHSYNRDIVFSTQAQATFSNVDGSALIIEKGNGNVGIGTASPVAKLHVNAGTSNTVGYFESTDARSRIVLKDNSGEVHLNAIGDNITFETSASGTERMRITSAGNVGIGTTSPDAKLDIEGDFESIYALKFTNTKGTGRVYGFRSHGVNGEDLSLYNGANRVQRWDENGNSIFDGSVGIGTDSPSQKLHVTGNARVTGAYYDSNNSPGTANQVLVSTVTGTDWVDGSGSSIIGGPYLPLTAGSGKSLTGTLYGTNTNWSGDGDYAGNLTLGTGASTQEAHLQIGQGRTGNGYSYIDLIGDATYTDYGLRVIRNNTGANTSSAIIHRGTGNLEIQATDSASILLRTNNTTALTLSNTQNATFAGDVNIDSALLSNQENTDVDTGTETIANVAIATYTAAFFDFVIKKTTNVRSGTVYACHDGTNVEFTETSTQDLGDTSDVTLSVDISGGNMRLRATTTSDDWSVKSLIRAI